MDYISLNSYAVTSNYMDTDADKELDSLKTELNKITIFRKEGLIRESLLENLIAFFKQLLPEEQQLLRILFRSSHAISIKQIRKKFVVSNVRKSFDILIKNPSLLQKVKIWKDQHKDEEFELMMKQMKHLLREKEKEGLGIDDFIGFVENLKDREIEEFISFFNKESPEKIPSYYKIKGLLETFEKNGITAGRELKDQKAEKVWFLSPSFSKIMFGVVNKIENSMKHDYAKVTALETEAHYLLTGTHFY
jgi:hypothetical protein